MIWSRPFLVLISIGLLMSVGALYAQTTGSIAGVVLDKNNGEPIPGANIFAEGASIGAATDDDGHFFIINIIIPSCRCSSISIPENVFH